MGTEYGHLNAGEREQISRQVLYSIPLPYHPVPVIA